MATLRAETILHGFIQPTEDIVHKGDLGASQASYGLDSSKKVECQRYLSAKAEKEPIELKPLTEKFDLQDADLRTFIISYMDYWLFGREHRIRPTRFGFEIGNTLRNIKNDEIWKIFRAFKRVDRIRIIEALSTGYAPHVRDLRKRMLFPGSMNYNLQELKRLKAISVSENKITAGGRYRDFLETLEMIEDCFASVRKTKPDEGLMNLRVSDIMTMHDIVTATLADTLVEVVGRMLLAGVNGIVAYSRGDEPRLIERTNALLAFDRGIATKSIGELPAEYILRPIKLSGNELVSVVVRRMNEKGVEHGVVMDQHGVQGIVSSKDVLSFQMYHHFPPGSTVA